MLPGPPCHGVSRKLGSRRTSILSGDGVDQVGEAGIDEIFEVVGVKGRDAVGTKGLCQDGIVCPLIGESGPFQPLQH